MLAGLFLVPPCVLLIRLFKLRVLMVLGVACGDSLCESIDSPIQLVNAFLVKIAFLL